jgi:DMSO/TMAO reductase YedYZ molybdopterin-dependent catalytic subunit
MGKAIGSELDGRLFTDLSALTEGNPITPSDEFFIRTRASKLLDTSAQWTIQVSGTANEPATIPIEFLQQKSRPMGIHHMECSGNTRAAHFGMLSVADWDGVPLQEILGMFKPRKLGARVHIAGFDRYQEESETSLPGAGWIFSMDQLVSSNAFLATRMNGQLLARDHGAPVRLMVPGWYGCVCIKWVDQIAFVPEDAPATTQMQEYAGRTMQTGVPSLARDYRPATVAAAAMPIRVEKWQVGGKIRYRVIGIRWGSLLPQQGLEIRFNPDELFVAVENHQTSGPDGWTFWSQEWAPTRVGGFTIRLRCEKTPGGAQRPNAGYYDRSVDIAEV